MNQPKNKSRRDDKIIDKQGQSIKKPQRGDIYYYLMSKFYECLLF